MKRIKLYQLVRLLSLLGILLLLFGEWSKGAAATLLILSPVLLVLLLANERAYQLRLPAVCRAFAGVAVLLLSMALLFDNNDDPQAGIGVALVIVIQYACIFVSEAIIGLVTYQGREDD